MPTFTICRASVFVLSLAAIGLALFQLLQERSGVLRETLTIGTTPAVSYRLGEGDPGPAVIIAHGFAGSQQLMQAYALTLARSGYRVLTFDFEGHGRNPVPMSGDVSSPEGTTRKLMNQIGTVIEAGKARFGVSEVALLGHSMATDVLARVEAEREDVAALVAVSMYSEVVTDAAPKRLLMITGAGEPHLRAFALEAVQDVSEGATEGETVEADGVVRRAVVAPGVEHVGVLFSGTALGEARAFLDRTFERQSDGPILRHGPWVALLLAGLVSLSWPLAALFPMGVAPVTVPSWRVVAAACLLPALTVPPFLSLFETRILPVLVADYVALHLALYGIAQSGVLWVAGVRPRLGPIWPVLPLLVMALGAFGLALDTFGASFVPHTGRFPIVAAIALGAVPFALSDAATLGAGHAHWLK
ncbi:MAG: alpha/beta fold hydrolase, partial [Pseudomonadota bacterium]